MTLKKSLSTWWNSIPEFIQKSTQLIAALTALIAAITAFIPYLPSSCARQIWKSNSEYQAEFEIKKNGYYPIKIEGRCVNNEDEFSAKWISLSPGKTFFSYHRLTEIEFQSLNKKYADMGLIVAYENTYKSCDGSSIKQATWLSK